MVSERLLGYIRFPCACDLSLILGVRFDDELASGSDGDDDNMDGLDESGGKCHTIGVSSRVSRGQRVGKLEDKEPFCRARDTPAGALA